MSRMTEEELVESESASEDWDYLEAACREIRACWQERDTLRDAIVRMRDYDGLSKRAQITAQKALAATAPRECPDCLDAQRLAYSDATTPGFLEPFCSKHKPTASEEKP